MTKINTEEISGPLSFFLRKRENLGYLSANTSLVREEKKEIMTTQSFKSKISFIDA